ncbi:MAG TPA: hypothetical protein VI754_14170 [Bacteriovoracaceae bacterium]|nr:hypothetical protein [Bacteriovoracaceae bacterium]
MSTDLDKEELVRPEILKSASNRFFFRIVGAMLGFFMVMFAVFQILFLAKVLPHGGLF